MKRSAGNWEINRGHFEILKRLLSAEATRLREESGCLDPPYNPEKIAELLGVAIEEKVMSGADGFVERNQGRYVAVISPMTHPLRQRFTLAHELGHVVLMNLEQKGTCMPVKRYRRKQPTSAVHQDPVEESLCNHFASELLLPSSDVQARLQKGALRPNTIIELASDFCVSKQAAAVKIFKHRLDVQACALWSLDTLFPMPVWWAGNKVRDRDNLDRLECLVSRRRNLTETWGTYDGRNRPVKVMVSPAGSRYSVVLILTTTRAF